MKLYRFLAAISALSFLGLAAAEPIAQARLYSYSVRFEPGSSGVGSTLALTTLETSVPPNGELAFGGGAYTHFSLFVLDFVGFPEPITGVLRVDVPAELDANLNDYADFFEVNREIPTTVTPGDYQASFNERGTVTATWRRGAGSPFGTCTLRLVSAEYGSLGDFVHSFEILEYTGALPYAATTNSVAGAVQLTRTGSPAHQLSGMLRFAKSAAAPEDELELVPGTLTNATGGVLVYTDDFYMRYGTNYFGFVEFDDGDLATTAGDYWLWALSIDDANDTDNDGVPNFSDAPPPDPTARPRLQVRLAPPRLELIVDGPLGHTYLIETAASLTTTDWVSAGSVTVTNRPQSVALPVPAASPTFWRARVQ
jgi:hypothetical protein